MANNKVEKMDFFLSADWGETKVIIRNGERNSNMAEINLYSSVQIQSNVNDTREHSF